MNSLPKELYIPEIIKDRSEKYDMNNDESYDWFTESYESTNDDNDILKMKDVYTIYQDSELYCSKTKEEKRVLNYKGFIEYNFTSIAFKGKYKNDKKKINGEVYYERIVKCKLKEVKWKKDYRGYSIKIHIMNLPIFKDMFLLKICFFRAFFSY
jgi:hypothetical protein